MLSLLYVLGVHVVFLERVVVAHVVFVVRVVVARILSARGRRRAVALWPRRYGGAGALMCTRRRCRPMPSSSYCVRMNVITQGLWARMVIVARWP